MQISLTKTIGKLQSARLRKATEDPRDHRRRNSGFGQRIAQQLGTFAIAHRLPVTQEGVGTGKNKSPVFFSESWKDDISGYFSQGLKQDDAGASTVTLENGHMP